MASLNELISGTLLSCDIFSQC